MKKRIETKFLWHAKNTPKIKYILSVDYDRSVSTLVKKEKLNKV